MAPKPLVDVTRLFEDAATEMQDGEIAMMSNYSLNDAMSAFEARIMSFIGEPRLDSGLPVPGVDEKPLDLFNPSKPLLPEELCWLMDRAFALQMGFHKGHFLAHTVYTLLHIHFLDHLDADLIPTSYFIEHHDPKRPVELIVLVLWSFMQGILKCTDFTWREFNKTNIFDQEDWQSDKCEVSLLEGTPVAFVISRLDEAITWVATSCKVPDPWAEALEARLLLLRGLLGLLASNVFKHASSIRQHIMSTRTSLQTLRRIPVPVPSTDSPVRDAVSPLIARQLSTFTPFVLVEPMGPLETWSAFESLLEYWEEIVALSQTHSLTTWTIVPSLRVQLGNLPSDYPYSRSLAQSTFYDNIFVLGRYTFQWLSNQLFLETLGVGWKDLVALIRHPLRGSVDGLNEVARCCTRVERTLASLLVGYVKSNFCNPSRRRRRHQQNLLGWQNAVDALEDLLRCSDLSNTQHTGPVHLIPHVAVYWRLRTILYDIVLAGFPIELYSKEEQCCAYWYSMNLVDSLVPIVESLLSSLPTDRSSELAENVREELEFQMEFAKGVKGISCALLTLLTPSIVPLKNPDSLRRSFMKRFKWAWIIEYQDLDSEPLCQPEIEEWLGYLNSVSTTVKMEEVKERAKEAKSLFAPLLFSGVGFAGRPWGDQRKKFVKNIVGTCETIIRIPDEFDVKKLSWGERTPGGLVRDDGCWFPRYLE
ncbi:Mak10 subunit, NatC N-terminal acetyltransferase-domain-containing protein [Flagelloscypha sp. PMI_526]|nr:Mak10 subunit, NatC N-terminal acetyltransferase-domain-containing protein [Flagelloscypha sp. PMI_526]